MKKIYIQVLLMLIILTNISFVLASENIENETDENAVSVDKLIEMYGEEFIKRGTFDDFSAVKRNEFMRLLDVILNEDYQDFMIFYSDYLPDDISEPNISSHRSVNHKLINPPDYGTLYYRKIKKMYAYGIVSPEEKKFRPNDNITMEEVLLYVDRINNKEKRYGYIEKNEDDEFLANVLSVGEYVDNQQEKIGLYNMYYGWIEELKYEPSIFIDLDGYKGKEGKWTKLKSKPVFDNFYYLKIMKDWDFKNDYEPFLQTEKLLKMINQYNETGVFPDKSILRSSYHDNFTSVYSNVYLPFMEIVNKLGCEIENINDDNEFEFVFENMHFAVVMEDDLNYKLIDKESGEKILSLSYSITGTDMRDLYSEAPIYTKEFRMFINHVNLNLPDNVPQYLYFEYNGFLDVGIGRTITKAEERLLENKRDDEGIVQGRGKTIYYEKKMNVNYFYDTVTSRMVIKDYFTDVDRANEYKITEEQKKEMKEKYDEITKRCKTIDEKAKAVAIWIYENTEYTYSPVYQNNNSKGWDLFSDRIGSCDGRDALFITMMRLDNIPTKSRHQYTGYVSNNGHSPYHVDSQYYNGERWVSLDVGWYQAGGDKSYWDMDHDAVGIFLGLLR